MSPRPFLEGCEWAVRFSLQNKIKLEYSVTGRKKSELHSCTAGVHRTLLGFLFPLLYTSAILYIMPEKGVNSNIKMPYFQNFCSADLVPRKVLGIAGFLELSLCCL